MLIHNSFIKSFSRDIIQQMMTTVTRVNWDTECVEEVLVQEVPSIKETITLPVIKEIQPIILPAIKETHALNNAWHFLINHPAVSKPADSDVLYLGTPAFEFDTIESFWGLYNNIFTPDRLREKISYMFYRPSFVKEYSGMDVYDYDRPDEIKISLPKQGNTVNPKINNMFANILLMIIGEIICDNSNVVSGVAFHSGTRESRICIIVENYSDEDIAEIKARMLKVVDIEGAVVKLTKYD